jgi:SAM-dependent methyltransferase
MVNPPHGNKSIATVWEHFWRKRSANPDDIYPNSPRIVDTLLARDIPGPVLEVGGGSSRDSVRLACCGRRVVVLDVTESALQLGKYFAARANVRLLLVRGDARHLPFADASFGTLFHQGLLEHFRNPRSLLVENRRVLRKGGSLLVDVPQTFHMWTLLKKALLPLGLWFGGWESQFTPTQLQRLVESAGFDIQTVYGEWMSPSLAYRLFREVGRRTGLWWLPLFPRWKGFAAMLRALDRRFLGSKLELWTGYVVGILAVKGAPEPRPGNGFTHRGGRDARDTRREEGGYSLQYLTDEQRGRS